MSYSCTDFVDDILRDFVDTGLINSDDIEDDNPQQQAELCLGALSLLLNSAADLLNSADVTGCSHDLVVVDRQALRELAKLLVQPLPGWLK